MIDTGTALAGMPKNELAVVARQEGAKADRLVKIQGRLAIGTVLGFTVALVSATAIASAPVVAPVLLVAGLVGFFGSSGAVLVLEPIRKKAEKRHSDAAARIDWLKGDSSAVSLRRSIAAFPEAAKFLPQPRWHPEPPTVRKPEKKLPRIKLG